MPEDPTAPGPGMYSQTLLDHFLRPRNVGRVEVVHGEGRVKSRVCQDLLEITLRIGADGALEARFRAQACSACIAGASMLTELVNAGRLDEPRARAIDGAFLARELAGVPSSKRRCVELAIVALDRALSDAASNREPGPPAGSP